MVRRMRLANCSRNVDGHRLAQIEKPRRTAMPADDAPDPG